MAIKSDPVGSAKEAQVAVAALQADPFDIRHCFIPCSCVEIVSALYTHNSTKGYTPMLPNSPCVVPYNFWGVNRVKYVLRGIKRKIDFHPIVKDGGHLTAESE